jgi:hypothetical protein
MLELRGGIALMTRIIVLFNLKPSTDRAAYEEWAKKVDIPGVNSLKSIDKFSVHVAEGLLGSDAKSPYEYIEVIDVADMNQFGKDVATEAMQRIAAEFQALADNPTFVLTRTLDAK